MKYKVIGWTDADDDNYPDCEWTRAAELAVIEELREKGYRFGANVHHFSQSGCPVLNDGTKFLETMRDWGAIMAEAIDPDSQVEYSYVDWLSHRRAKEIWGKINVPKRGVDRSQIVPASEIDKSDPEDKK